MNEITNTLNQLAEVTASVEKLVAQLKDDGSDYADAAAHAKKNGERVEAFGGSAAQKTLDAVSIKLKSASQAVQFVGTELVRFS